MYDCNQLASIKVGIVTTSFPVVKNSSSGIFVKRLATQIAKLADTTVLTPNFPEATECSESSAYKLTFFSYGPHRWQKLAHRPGGIPDALRRRDPAILLIPILLPAMFIACFRLAGKVDVIHGNWSVPGVIGALAAKTRGIESIVTLRGEDVTRAQKTSLFGFVLLACLALNRYTVVVSEAMREDISERYPKYKNRIVFIPNGVASGESERRGALRSPLRLVTVSSLIHRKRLDVLIHAVSKINEENNVELRIIGAGALRAQLEALSSTLGLVNQIQFVGGVAPGEVGQHLDWADIFVFASESEGRPNVVLEAMAHALPVIATDIPGVRELVTEDTGLLYPVGQPEALARGIESLLDHEDRAKTLGENAKEYIDRKGLSWASAAQSYADLYLAAINGNKKA